jgi:hypothetical protein
MSGIEATKYAMVNIITGKVIWCDTLEFVSYEWARHWYEFGQRDCEVREIHMKEVRTLSKKELDAFVDKTYGDETQYGIHWHVDVDKNDTA